jgi:hypothetical protein
MSTRYIPREGEPLPVEKVLPGSPRAKEQVEKFKAVLKKYVKYEVSPETLDRIALELWQSTITRDESVEP